MSPTSRSLKFLREQGFVADTAQKFLMAGKGLSKDIFGFGDIIGFNPEKGVNVIVQTTTGDHLADRRKKVLACENAGKWLRVPTNRIELHAWARRERKNQRIKIELICEKVVLHDSQLLILRETI